MNHPQESHDSPRFLRWAFWGLAAIAGFFLITEHGAHLLGVLPFLLILACPLIHIFGHNGHGHGHQETPDPSRAPSDQAAGDERDNSRAGHHHH